MLYKRARDSRRSRKERIIFRQHRGRGVRYTHMLPASNRIKKKTDFEAIFKNSKSFKNSFFILKIAKNNLAFNRFGFVVSKKVSKKAVTRNKVRRRLAEAIKKETEGIKGGIDIIVIALPQIAKADFYEIKESVGSMLVKGGLIKQK